MQFLRKDAGGARRAEGRALKPLRVHRDQIHQYEFLADRLGHQSGVVAMSWLPASPAIPAPIIGPHTQEQLDAAPRALDVEREIPTLIRLDVFFPGCRTAPEDYAW